MYDVLGLHKNMKHSKEQTIKVYMPARAKEKADVVCNLKDQESNPHETGKAND